MPSWKKVLISGSDAALNKLTVINGITGSLFGTASYASGSVFTSTNPALSASYALTASYVMGGGGGGISFPYIGDVQITGSLLVSGSTAITGNINVSGGQVKVDGINVLDTALAYSIALG